MLLMAFWRFFRLGVPYNPQPDERSFLERAELQKDDEVVVNAAVLDARESDRFFGVSLSRRGIQPVWLEITNYSKHPHRLRLASIDPNYYPPLEAAYTNHYHIGRRLAGFGFLAWLFLPMLILLVFKIRGARAANRRMDAFFQKHGIGCGLVHPGGHLSGFVFTALDEGTKQFTVRLQSTGQTKDFSFSIPVPGLRVDHGGRRFEALLEESNVVDCEEAELRKRLEAFPKSTSNRKATAEGDPLNLVAIGDFDTVLNGFGARWDETEIISLRSCWRTLKAFSLGSRYRYSPVSSLYLEGRHQDFALQKARQTINERLHLRLWLTPLRYQGKPVWIGQISRDIGVRFTWKTWNLTTHKIDPNVDEARDYVLDDLMNAGRVSQVAYVAGAVAADGTTPRHNLTGDPYFTDGLRAVAIFSETRTEATFLDWT
jgi:hypothetical protein